jgi:hypothetical protein
MNKFLILHEGRKQLVADLAGYEGAKVLAEGVADPPDGLSADDLNDDGTAPLDKLQANALANIDREQEEAASQLAQSMNAIAVTELWTDLKRLERDQADGKIPATVAERAERYPFLSALASEANVTLAVAATAVKDEIGPQVRQLAAFAARAILARRKVRQAASATAVQQAAQMELTNGG